MKCSIDAAYLDVSILYIQRCCQVFSVERLMIREVYDKANLSALGSLLLQKTGDCKDVLWGPL